MSASTTKPTHPQDHVVTDLSLADWGRKEIQIAETEMPGLMAIREEYATPAAAEGRPHRRVAAHDHPDRGAHRDPAGARRRGAVGLAATSSRPRTTPPPRSPPPASPVFAFKGETLDEYWDYTHRIFEWPAGRPRQHDPRRRRRRHAAPPPRRARPRRTPSVVAQPTSEEETVLFAAIKAKLAKDPAWYSTRLAQGPGRDRRDHHGRQAPLPDGQGGPPQVPRHQRQRLGHQEQVRQPLRLPRVAGRRHQARHRRDGGRQGRGRLRLRRRGQGQRPGAARALAPRCGSPRSIPSARSRPRWKATASSPWTRRADQADIFVTATGNFHVITPRPHEADEEQRDRLQHRPLRQRDRRRLARAVRVGEHQAAGRPRHLPRRQAHHPARRGAPGEPRLRHRATRAT